MKKNGVFAFVLVSVMSSAYSEEFCLNLKYKTMDQQVIAEVFCDITQNMVEGNRSALFRCVGNNSAGVHGKILSPSLVGADYRRNANYVVYDFYPTKPIGQFASAVSGIQFFPTPEKTAPVKIFFDRERPALVNSKVFFEDRGNVIQGDLTVSAYGAKCF